MSAPRWSDPGVHVAPAGVPPERVGPIGTERTVAVCRLGEHPTKASLLDGLADALDLPEWFGRNWDALADSLCDLPRPTVLLIDGLDRLDDAVAATLLEVAVRAAWDKRRGPATLSVVLTDELA